MLRIVLLVLIAGWSAMGVAQTPHQYVARGDKELLDGYPQSAQFYYKKALSIDTTMVEANFKMGEAYRALRNYKRAAKAYERCASLDDQDAFPEALYWNGVMLKQMGDYKMAKRKFQHFLSVYSLRDDFYRGARDEITSCDWALEHINDTANFEVHIPDTGLNTVHAEMSPYWIDSATMYFATMRYESDEVKKSQPVFVEIKKAVKDSMAWNLVELDLPIADVTMHVGNGSFSADSTSFFFTKCPDPSSCAIYRIIREHATWSSPERLPTPINEEGSSNTQPMLASFDGEETLYFVSDRKSGKGGYDIWFVPFKNGEPTSRLRNAGTRINTQGNEITPWFDDDDTTFYFSSDRLVGFGGFDIFKSQGEPGRYNTVENAGTDINSPADDYYFAFRANDSLGYFASNRIAGTKKSGNETCCNDLYKVKVKPIPKDTVVVPLPMDTTDSVMADTNTLVAKDTFTIPETMEELQDLLPISLYFHNDRPNPRTMDLTTELTYPETIEEYKTLRSEYLREIAEAAIDDTTEYRMYEETKRFFQNDLTGSVDRINAALNVLLQELAQGNSATIAVKGYASPLANTEYNLNLTYRRIDAMENYIEQYEDGAFLPYLTGDSTTLTIEKIPYGESKASKTVSDSGNDRLNAIYSPSAARERRIEILRVEKDQN
ncbi:MAG: hypothetical protein Salg2KO_09260 [Salibacteraceae bacterium]